jgi:hypothetical protein
VVPPDSRAIPRVAHYLGCRPGVVGILSTGVSPSAPALSRPSTIPTISYSLPDQQFRLVVPTTPNWQRLPAITPVRFGLFRFRSPLLTESLLFSLPVGTEMFHFPTLPPYALCVQAPVTGHDPSRVSPFRNPRINVRLPTPRGFSQAPTSFIGSWCQGIHRVPLITCQTHNFKDARVHYAVLKIRAESACAGRVPDECRAVRRRGAPSARPSGSMAPSEQARRSPAETGDLMA